MNMLDEKIKELGGIENVLGGNVSPMSEKQILEIEKIRASLPDYISSSGNGNFDYFFGSVNDDDTYALTWALDAYHGRMPHSLIPVGGDLGGGVICLGISGDHFGKIYYWDPMNELDPDDLEDGDDIEG